MNDIQNIDKQQGMEQLYVSIKEILANARKRAYSAVNFAMVTKRQAPRSFPKVFTDSSAKTVELERRTIILRVSNEQYAFLSRFGNISAYLRQLIDKQMQNL